MNRAMNSLLTVFITFFCGVSAFADTFVVNFHELDGLPLRGTGGLHNTLTVYQEVRGSEVDDLANNVRVNAPKLRLPIAIVPVPIDLDDDGQITFSLNLTPGPGDRSIVIVAQRFDEASPSTALAFVVVSSNNMRNHVLDIAVPRVSVRSAAPTYQAPSPRRGCRCFLFRRRCQ
jgi:hypothetical protein